MQKNLPKDVHNGPNSELLPSSYLSLRMWNSRVHKSVKILIVKPVKCLVVSIKFLFHERAIIDLQVSSAQTNGFWSKYSVKLPYVQHTI